MTVTITTTEDAIYDWVVSASGLAEDGDGPHVVWSHQYGPRLVTPFISLMISGDVKVGRGWTDKEVNPTPSPGAMVRQITRAHRLATLSIQCFADGMDGLSGAVAILRRLSNLTPQHVRDLNTGGVGVAGFGPISAVGNAMSGPLLEPRAAMEVQLHLADEVVTYIGDIGTVEVTNQLTDPDQLLTIDVGVRRGATVVTLGAATASADGEVDP